VPAWLRTADVAASLLFFVTVAFGLLDEARSRLWSLIVSATLCIVVALTAWYLVIRLLG
jgi:hypothetical protein